MSIQRREVRLTKIKTSSPRVVPLSNVAIGTLVGTPRHITSPYVFWHDDGATTPTVLTLTIGIGYGGRGGYDGDVDTRRKSSGNRGVGAGATGRGDVARRCCRSRT